MTDDIVEDFIQHYGKKGMKWGERRAVAKTTKAANKAKNQASLAKDKEARKKIIESHRAKVTSGQSKAEFKKAKAEYSVNKAKLGSYEANKILQQARNKHYDEVEIANAAKDGKEVARNVLVTVGVLGVAALLGTAMGGSGRR